MRVKHKVVLNIGDDTEFKDKLFSLDDTLAEVTSDAFQKCVSGRAAIQASATEALSLGDLAVVRGLYIKADVELQVAMNGSADKLQMRRAQATSDHPATLFFEGDVTSVSVTAGVTAANLVYCAWGDPSA